MEYRFIYTKVQNYILQNRISNCYLHISPPFYSQGGSSSSSVIHDKLLSELCCPLSQKESSLWAGLYSVESLESTLLMEFSEPKGSQDSLEYCERRVRDEGDCVSFFLSFEALDFSGVEALFSTSLK